MGVRNVGYMLNILVEKALFDFVEQIENGSEVRDVIKNLLKRHYMFIVNNQELIKILLFEVQFHKELKTRFYDDILIKSI